MEAKQLRLTTSIQSSFGKPDDPDYVFDITVNGDKSVMAVSLSTNAIKLYNPETGQYKSDLLGHSETITDLNFPDPNSPFLLFSSSTDATVRTWDIRTGKKAAVFKAPKSSDELWCLSVGGDSAHLVAAGGEAKVFIWDWKTQKLQTSLDEWHSEAVTQARFHPSKTEKLVTVSVDGMINVFDTNAAFDSQEIHTSSMKPGTSLSTFGFFGEKNEMLWVLTHIETLSVWNWQKEVEVASFGDTRTKASYSWSLPSVSYLINCHSPRETDSLWLAAGNNDGSVGYFPASFTKSRDSSIASVGGIGQVSAVLDGGHQDVVRSIWLNEDSGLQQPVFCWTGGEDGRLCSWSQNGSTERGRSWMSSNLVIRKGGGSQHRSRPY